jgi:hypothetical protein
MSAGIFAPDKSVADLASNPGQDYYLYMTSEEVPNYLKSMDDTVVDLV